MKKSKFLIAAIVALMTVPSLQSCVDTQDDLQELEQIHKSTVDQDGGDDDEINDVPE